MRVNGNLTTVLGSVSASSDTMEFEERQMKQCWMKYVKIIQNISFYFWYLSLTASLFCWSRIFKRLWSPGIDSKEWIPRAYVAWRAGTRTLFLVCSYPPRLYKNSSSGFFLLYNHGKITRYWPEGRGVRIETFLWSRAPWKILLRNFAPVVGHNHAPKHTKSVPTSDSLKNLWPTYFKNLLRARFCC